MPKTCLMECKKAGELNSLYLVTCKWQVLRFRGEWISTEHQPAVWPLSLNPFSVLSTRNPVDHWLLCIFQVEEAAKAMQECSGGCGSRWGGPKAGMWSPLNHIPASSLWLMWWKALGKQCRSDKPHWGLQAFSAQLQGKVEGGRHRLEQSKGKRNLEGYVSCSSLWDAGLKPSNSCFPLSLPAGFLVNSNFSDKVPLLYPVANFQQR